MTTLTKKRRADIDSLIGSGQEPKKQKTTDGHTLGRVLLVRGDGSATAAGKYWERATGKSLPTGGWDPTQRPVRMGNTETIRLRNGKQAVTRTWDAADGEYRFTKLGHTFYKRLTRNYVVSVPVHITKTDANGVPYKVKSSMPIEKAGIGRQTLPLNLTHAERLEKIKEMVKRQLPEGTLMEFSREKWTYDDTGAWLIHEETIGVDPDTNQAEAHVILDRRGGAAPSVCCDLPYARDIHPEAFKASDQKDCCPRQIAAVLKADLAQVCHDLTLVEQGLYKRSTWREEGCTPRMVLGYARMHCLGCCVLHAGRVIESIPGTPILAFSIHEDHFYFYGSKKTCRILLLGKKSGQTPHLKKEYKATSAPFSEWTAWQYEIADGHFHTSEEELPKVRAWFLSKNRRPRVVLKDEWKPKSLIYDMHRGVDGVEGRCFIHSVPEYADKICQWLKELGDFMPYRGEGLPNISAKVLVHLLKHGRQRVTLTGEEKAELLDQYNHRCALCNSTSDFLEWDHVERYSESFEQTSFQPLCPECHREKTQKEPRSFDQDPLLSHFEKEVYNQYVKSPRPPPLVHRAKELGDEGIAGCEIADVQRCRKRALQFNVHDLPIFSPLDDIRVRTRPELGDICFLTKTYKSCVSQLGYTGPGWYHRCQVEWLLHTGTVTWDDITHILTATAHYPADLLRRPLEMMEEAWDGDRLAKTSANSLIGLWCIDESFDYRLSSSTHDNDRPPGATMQTFDYGDGQIIDFVQRTPVVSSGSYRALHDLCMCTEATRVGQMLYILKQSRGIPYEIKTDSVLYRPLKRQRRCLLAETCFSDLSNLRDIYEGGRQNRLNSYHAVRPIPNGERPFRVEKAKDEDKLQCEPNGPERTWALNLQPRVWADLTEETAAQRVMDRGCGLLVLGIAGTGKTHWMRNLVEQLRTAGRKVEIVSKTHTASARAGGKTADYFVRKWIMQGQCNGADYIWVDEISQADAGILTQLNKLLYLNVKFLLSGDFNQFPPIFDSYRGTPVSEECFRQSNLLHTMADGNRLTLTTCRRSETALFDFYRSLIPGGSRYDIPLEEAVQAARREFTYSQPCRYNFVISHQKRRKVNRELNHLWAPPDAVFLKVRATKSSGGQDMLIWPGIQLFGNVTAEKKGIRNHVLYTVKCIEKEKVRLVGLPHWYTFEQVKKWLVLAYAQTYASCQGTECDGPVCLWDTSHIYFTRRHLFVGLSRAKDPAFIAIKG